MGAIGRQEAVRAWMRAIAAKGWHGATVRDAAEGSPDLAAADLVEALADKLDALAALFDQAAARAAQTAAAADGVREALFDGVMAGFDVLQPHRDGLLAIRAARDPGVALLLAGRAGPAVRRLASAAGMGTTRLADQVRLAALTALIGRAAATWLDDDSPDMAATMAELDRLLARAERAATEGPSLDLLGLPGLSRLFDRFRPGAAPPDPARPRAPARPGE
ncbi:MAG: hypothetical protein ACK4Z0_00685 [Sphingomonadaceae bacterium]